MRPLIYLICLKLSLTSTTALETIDNLNLTSDVHDFDKTSFFTFIHFSGSQREILSTKNDLCSVKQVGEETKPLKVNITTTTPVKYYNESTPQKWYILNQNSINVFELRNWKSRCPFLKSTSDLLQASKRGFNGKVLLTAIVESEHQDLKNFINNLMRALEEAANFTTNQLEVAKEYGAWNETNKTWSGAVGLIVTGKVDLITSWMVMTSKRLSYVDFTIPLKKTELFLWIKEPNSPKLVTIYGYTQPFTFEVWAVIILLSVAAHCLLIFIKMNTSKNYSCYDFEDFLHIWGSYCKQSSPGLAKRISARMVYSSIFLLAFFITAVYSACLVSSITIFEPTLPFNTLRGFVKDGSYKLTVLRDSSEHDLFQNSNQSMWKRMNKLMMKSKDLPTNIYEVWNMMCKDKVAYFGYDLLFHGIKKNSLCSLVKIGSGRYSSFAMILRKNSPYTKIINHYLTQYRDSGVLDYIDSKFYRNMITSKYEYQYNAVIIKEIFPLLFILMGGILSSCAILVVEKIYSWCYL